MRRPFQGILGRIAVRANALETGPGWAVTRLTILLALFLLAPTRPAAAMEHEEIVARLATGQCVPSYETRACRKFRRQRDSGARAPSAVHLTK